MERVFMRIMFVYIELNCLCVCVCVYLWVSVLLVKHECLRGWLGCLFIQTTICAKCMMCNMKNIVCVYISTVCACSLSFQILWCLYMQGKLCVCTLIPLSELCVYWVVTLHISVESTHYSYSSLNLFLSLLLLLLHSFPLSPPTLLCMSLFPFLSPIPLCLPLSSCLNLSSSISLNWQLAKPCPL